MNVEPVGLPASMKAWRQRDPEPIVVVRCGAELGCRHEVGAVYKSPEGVVVESRVTVPDEPAEPTAVGGLADLAGDLGVVGLLDDMPGVDPVPLFEDAPGPVPLFEDPPGWTGPATPAPEPPPTPEQAAEDKRSLRVQVDLLHVDFYWHDPSPLCPEHGRLRLDRNALMEAVRSGRPFYLAGA